MAVVVLLGTAWTGFRAYQVQRSLAASVADAKDLRSAVADQDLEALPALLAELQDDSGEAARRTNGLSWRALGVLPVVGDDADGVRTISNVVHDLSVGGLEEAVQAAEQLDVLAPRDGRVDIEAVRDLQPSIAAASRALSEADATLAEVDSSGFVRPLQRGFDDLASQTASGADAMRAADATAQVLPAALGAEDLQRYLVVFQNNAEVRATGGLPGSTALLTADDGRLRLVRQVAGNSFGRRESPVLPLTPGELNLFGSQLGTFFLDAGYTPDFDRAADLWRARWSERFAEPVDGVLAIDTVALSYVIDALGPIDVDGVRLTGDNAVDELLSGVYRRNPDEPAAQDRFFQQVASTVFARISAGDLEPRAFYTGLARATAEGRILLTSYDDDVVGPLEDEAITGPDLQDEDPEFIVTLDDASPDKMTYYLHSEARLLPRYCLGGDQQTYDVKLRLSSTAPEDVSDLPDYVTGAGKRTDEGNIALTVRLFAPPGALVGDATLNRRQVEVDAQEFEGHTVSTVEVDLEPGEIVDLSWRAVGAPGETGATAMWATPTIGSGTQETADPVC